MKSDQSRSRKKLNAKNSSAHKPEESLSADEIEASESVNSQHISSTVDDEVLRLRIRKLVEEKPSPSTFQRISSNPLITVIVGFLLTGLLGGFLTNYYNRKQKELESLRTTEQRESDRQREQQQRELDRKREDDRRESDRLRGDQQRESERIYQERQKELEYQRALSQTRLEHQRDLQQRELERERSFYDELNKSRAQKIGEVWEGIYQFESELGKELNEIEKILSQISKLNPRPSSSEEIREALKQLKELDSKASGHANKAGESLGKLHAVVNKNRFWLGEDIYHQIDSYAAVSLDYLLAKIKKKSEKEEKVLSEKRETLRQSILFIRDKLLKGERTSNNSFNPRPR